MSNTPNLPQIQTERPSLEIKKEVENMYIETAQEMVQIENQSKPKRFIWFILICIIFSIGYYIYNPFFTISSLLLTESSLKKTEDTVITVPPSSHQTKVSIQTGLRLISHSFDANVSIIQLAIQDTSSFFLTNNCPLLLEVDKKKYKYYALKFSLTQETPTCLIVTLYYPSIIQTKQKTASVVLREDCLDCKGNPSCLFEEIRID